MGKDFETCYKRIEAKDRPAFDVHWYEGSLRNRVPLPPAMKGRRKENGGLVIEGEKGVIHVIGSHNSSAILVPESARKSCSSIVWPSTV